jgi:hypothetical protein
MRRPAIIILILTGLLVGCGPVGSTARIGDAEASLERARVAEAQERAPYEYYMAAYYLHKAKEEWGYSDFEASRAYATEAKRSAEAALLKAKEDPWAGSPVPEDKRREAMAPPKKGLNMNKRPTEQVKEREKQEKDILDNPNGD